MTFDVTIYQQGHMYYSIENNRQRRLYKLEDRYYIDGSPSSDFYVITDKGKLILADRLGDFSDKYIIKKIE